MKSERDKDIPVNNNNKERKKRERENCFTRKTKKLPVNRPFKIISRSGKKENKTLWGEFHHIPILLFVFQQSVPRNTLFWSLRQGTILATALWMLSNWPFLLLNLRYPFTLWPGSFVNVLSSWIRPIRIACPWSKRGRVAESFRPSFQKRLI